jgi:hypothetical protein
LSHRCAAGLNAPGSRCVPEINRCSRVSGLKWSLVARINLLNKIGRENGYHKHRRCRPSGLPNVPPVHCAAKVRQFHETWRTVSDVIDSRIPHRSAFLYDGAESLCTRAIDPSRVRKLCPYHGLQCPMQYAILLLRELVADHFFFGPRRLCSTWPTAFFSPRV